MNPTSTNSISTRFPPVTKTAKVTKAGSRELCQDGEILGRHHHIEAHTTCFTVPINSPPTIDRRLCLASASPLGKKVHVWTTCIELAIALLPSNLPQVSHAQRGVGSLSPRLTIRDSSRKQEIRVKLKSALCLAQDQIASRVQGVDMIGAGRRFLTSTVGHKQAMPR